MENGNVYDITINEAAKILDKSDRQVRRYVKERRLKAKPIKIGGHVRLMFNEAEIISFRDNLQSADRVAPSIDAVIVDVSQADGHTGVYDQVAEASDADESAPSDTEAVKLVIDVLKDQIDDLRRENRELHGQIEKHSGLIGFWQGKAELLQEELKALAPVPKEEKPERNWWQKLWGIE